ncbi:quinone oxidoreductase family protein [Phytohabitans sp. LJ34]|uniref:quinone oxidoreductase family protein n=1 Tax=Phytohabitans sp. LJ34 TaxID=3452217 RepID=UPI003F890B5B
MRALQVSSLDGPGSARLVEMPIPTPGPGEVLVRVTVAGINFADTQESRGTYPFGRTPPYIAGNELVGEIVATGPGVTGVAIGQRVYGGGGGGTFAEYATLPAAGFVPVPAGWTDAQAIGLLSNWATAYAALRTVGRLTEGETVLIHAAAGGVGQAAVHLARHFGARVLATTSTVEKQDRLRDLGVADVLGYEDFADEALRLTGGAGVDVVFDGVGGDVFRRSLTVTKRHTGRLVVVGIVAGETATSNREVLWDHPVQLLGLNMRHIFMHQHDLMAEILTELMQVFATQPPPAATLVSLENGPRVLADVERRGTVGKLGLTP